MYVLTAPDGSIQLTTLSPDFPTCVTFCEMLADVGMSKPLVELFNAGFTIMPVMVTIKQNGDENKPFKM